MTERMAEHHTPKVVGGPAVFSWDCPCGKHTSKTWPSAFEAAYAAVIHVRNPGGPC